MNSMACYNESTLKEYLAGWTDEPSSSRIESHLSECQTCEQTLAALEGESDTLVACVQASCASRVASSDAEPNSSPAAIDHCDLEWPRDQVHILEAAKQLVHESGNDDGAASGQNIAARSIDSSERIGDYELIRPIGRGGMGAVFEARHTRLDKRFALKLLPATAFRSEAFAARFEREMRAAGSLSHPAIVQATDAGECPQAHYLAMELVDGLDVSKLLAATGGPLSVRHACEVGRQVALALTYAHAKGIVHRDIKPSNVMISVDGDIKLLDFGLATTSLWDGTTAELTTVGQLMGTLDYMAPEQAESPETVDYRADLYGLGATLFRMLTGRTPLAASPTLSPITKLRLLAMHSPPSLATLCPECPQGLVQLVDSLLARHPEDRPPSAAHVAELLEPWTGDDGLATLVSEAMDVTEQEDQGAMSAAGFVTVALAEGHSESTVNHSGFWTRVLAGASMLALVAAGILFTVETRKGELVIESDVPGVQVTIVQDGRENRELTVSASPKKTRLFAGSYEVRLSEGSDTVEVVDGVFELSRGETKIARVRLRKPSKPGAISEASGRLPASSSPLKPGDRLEVQSLVDEGLNCTAVVQADGTAKFPLVGTLDASGMTVAEFEKRLEGSLALFMKNPAISLRRGFSGLNAMADFVPPASTATLQPGDALLMRSMAIESLQARLVVQADLMIEPLQLAPVSVRGLTVDGAEAMLNDLYSPQAKNPEIELFRDFSTPNPRWQKRDDRDGMVVTPSKTNWGQALYEGKPLSEWVDLLARERSYELKMKAMNAIQATYNPRAAELVREAALVSLRGASGDEWMLASLLRRTTETNEEYYELLLGEFKRPNCSTDQKKRMLQWMLFTNNDETPEQMSRVLAWIESEVLSGDQPELVQVVFDTFFTALNEHATFGFSRENVQADHPVFEMLQSSDVVSDRMWFPTNGPAGSGITRLDRFNAMKAPWASEVARRAVAMIHDGGLSKNKADQVVEAADVLVEITKRSDSGQIGLSSQELQDVVTSLLETFSGHRAQLAGVDQARYTPSGLPNQVHILGCNVRISIDARVSIPLLVVISLAEQAYPADEYQNWLESQATELVAASSEVAQRARRFVVKASQLVGDDGVDEIVFIKTCIALATIYDKADDELRDRLSNGMGLAGK